MLIAVQKLADEIPLSNQTNTFTTVRKNIGLSIAIVDTAASTGITVEGLPTAAIGYNNVTLKNTMTQSVSSTAIVNFFLPPTLFRKIPSNVNRISAFIYDNVKLFLTSQNLSNADLINSKVMSTSFKGIQLKDLPVEDELRSSFSPIDQNLTGSVNCVFWNFTNSSE